MQICQTPVSNHTPLIPANFVDILKQFFSMQHPDTSPILYIAKGLLWDALWGCLQNCTFRKLRCFAARRSFQKDWRGALFMDLSRPLGSSVNDYISITEFTLNYCSADDAINIISKLGVGTLMAKLDLGIWDTLSRVGILSFATKCIPAERIFLRRMLKLAHLVKHLHYTVNFNASSMQIFIGGTVFYLSGKRLFRF